MKVLLAWSSGKDSAWALHVLQREHPGSVAALLTTINESVDRVAMHGVGHDVLRAQASAAGLPLRVVGIPSPCSNEVYLERMAVAVTQAVGDGFTHAAFGDLFLEDVRAYREDQLRGSGLQPLFPVWGRPTRAFAEEMIASGLRARVACIDTRRLDRAFVGREFDATLLSTFPSDIDPCGENGELHTCVYDDPMFRHPLRVENGALVEHEPFLWSDLVLVNQP